MAAGGLLQLWERADGLSPVERALTLAEAAGGERDLLLNAPYGQTNAQVLALRESVLGPALTATASCPRCQARVVFTIEVADLRSQVPGEGPASFTAGDCVVHWRSPGPGDLLAIATEPDPERALRSRCLSATLAGNPLDLSALPAEVLDRADRAMSEADPLAEVLVALTCPDCATAFDSDFDLSAFVWTEVEARAEQVLHEVDVLARCYGWTEPEVLALSEARRAAYLRIALDGGR